jgi:hypothetical protein
LYAYLELLIGSLIALNMYGAIPFDARTGADEWALFFALFTLIPVLSFALLVSWYTLYHVRWLTNLRRRDVLIVILEKFTSEEQQRLQ